MERLYNIVGRRLPSHRIRATWLRFAGAAIGDGTVIGLGTRVHGPSHLSIGPHCSIGDHCLLDARGGITIEHDTVFDHDVQLIAGHHDVHSSDFGNVFMSIEIGHHAWVACRVLVTGGVRIGDGAVVEPCSMVRSDIAAMAIASGIPATATATRTSPLSYRPV
ncbi:acyltransferase [Williamsia sp. CHRR-6]|uniref:acyltransferase n=1 Tax=Williamsia sp. CHRR-6 TaxID=2835871 RepID=UPI001BDA8E1C|nr:acyltransferase [Williamsia sp. CHRR-6]MBT0565922.1 acyltransferase [Williamsia sp. CHRR-6]